MYTMNLVPSGQKKCKRCGRWFQPKGLNRDFSASEKQKIVDVCMEAVRKLGYHEVEMSGDGVFV